jgi:deoxyribodipyrimidine photolyase-like uncharacterized protein
MIAVSFCMLGAGDNGKNKKRKTHWIMKLMVVSNFVILFDQSESILERFFDFFWFTSNLKK